MRGRIEWLLRRPLLLVAAAALLVALPLTVAGEVSAEQSRAILRQQEVDAARTSAAAAADAAQAWLAAVREDVAALANNGAIQTAVADRGRDAIASVVRAAEPFLETTRGGPVRWIFVTDASGAVLFEAANERLTTGRDLSTTELHRGLAARPLPVSPIVSGVTLIPVGTPTGQDVLGTVRVEPALGVLIGAPVRFGSRAFVGAVVVEPRVEQLERTLRSQMGDASDVYLVDGRGSVVVHASREPSATRRPMGDDLGRDTEMGRALGASPDARVTGRRVVASAPVGDTGWHIAVAGPAGIRVAAIEGDLAQQRAVRLALVALLLVSAVVLGRTASASISRRDELRDALDRNTQLFREIQEKSRELEDASRHKSEFLASMSHELRTPLNAIIGFNDVVAQGMAGPITDKQREYIADALTSAHHLLALINEILDLSKVEAGRMDLEPSVFSLRDLVEASTVVIRERASRHGIAVRADVDGADTVEADERKVRQVLFNLLSNAVKFTPDGGEIEVKAWHVDAEWGVKVTDTGPGILPADRERIFEEFQQSRASGARVSEGTGLGLTLSRKFVELHGGRIWVESEVGKGSTFTFAIPKARERARV